MSGVGKSLLAGIIGGAVGAIVWAIISYYANAEVGWIAWGIGFVVGVFVRVAAGEAFEGPLPGAMAAGIAILSVVIGKYAAVHMAVSAVDLNAVAVDVTDEQMIVALADEIIGEREAKGQKVALPGGKTLDDANSQADYPPAIWREASQKWTKLGPAGQQQQKDQRQAELRQLIDGLRGAAARNAFTESFTPYDALWFFLAAITAFKIGHGNIADND